MALNYSKGTIATIGEVVSGTSSRGNAWQRTTLTLDVPGYQGAIYKIVFQVSGDKVNEVVSGFAEGDKVEIGWSIYAREYNDRWYNNVDLVTIKRQGEVAESAPAPAPAPTADDLDTNAHQDDLPF